MSTTTDTQHQLVQDCQLKNIMSIPGTCQSEPIQMYLCKEARNQEVTDNLSCHDCTSLYKSIISEHVLVQDSYILYCWIKQGQRTSQTTGALAILFLVVNILPDFKAILSKKNYGQGRGRFLSCWRIFCTIPEDSAASSLPQNLPLYSTKSME